MAKKEIPTMGTLLGSALTTLAAHFWLQKTARGRALATPARSGRK
jgi:hypothetical protein